MNDESKAEVKRQFELLGSLIDETDASILAHHFRRGGTARDLARMRIYMAAHRAPQYALEVY